MIDAVILGIIQGISEWFPISSSAHLALAQRYLGIREPVIFDVILHLGSLVVIFAVFYKQIKNLVLRAIKKEKKALDYITMLIIASIPIAVLGLVFNSHIKQVFESTQTIGISLIVTSIFLFMSQYVKKDKKLNRKNTFTIGLAQSLALLPGISRSGITISSGMLQGIGQEDAATFSFLLAIPAILGASILEFKNIGQVTNLDTLLIATIVTIITGYISLKLLMKTIRKIHYFGWYCLFLGISLII